MHNNNLSFSLSLWQSKIDDMTIGAILHEGNSVEEECLVRICHESMPNISILSFPRRHFRRNVFDAEFDGSSYFHKGIYLIEQNSAVFCPSACIAGHLPRGWCQNNSLLHISFERPLPTSFQPFYERQAGF